MRIILLTLLVCVVAPLAAVAQAAGAAEAEILQGLISGKIGLLIGLIIGAIGTWSFFIKGQFWGLIMLAGGIVLTAFPSMFNSTYKGADPFLDGVAPGLQRIEGLPR